MKRIEAVIKPFKVDDVHEALEKINIIRFIISEIKGFSEQKGHTEIYRGAEYTVDFLPKAKITVEVVDDKVDAVVKAIAESALTGKPGDGSITVSDIGKVIDIQTGANLTDPQAIGGHVARHAARDSDTKSPART